MGRGRGVVREGLLYVRRACRAHGHHVVQGTRKHSEATARANL